MQYNWKTWSAIFVILQVLVNVVASKEVILGHWEDSKLQSWNPYKQSSGSGWFIPPNSDPRYWDVCDYFVNTEPSSWLRNDLFFVDEANTVYITVGYSITKCSSLTGPQKQHCKEWLSLHVNQTDNLIDKSLYPDLRVNPDAYEKIGNLTAIDNETTFPLRTKGKYLMIALHDQGSCTALYSVKVHYYLCPGETLNSSLLTLPETVAPANDAAPIRVEGDCTVENSIKMPGSLIVLCESNGEWNTSETEGKCVCKQGTENLGGQCKTCSNGQFNDLENSTCIPCPANSLSTSERTRCDCNETFYRTQWESIRENCTRVPSAPRHAIASFVNQTAVVLEWFPPDSNGGRNDVFYEVECRKPCNETDGTDCVTKLCRDDVNYLPNKDHVNETKIIVTNLLSFVNYTFIIYAKNGVSAVARTKDGIIPHSTNLYIRTNGTVPGEPKVSADWLGESSTVSLSWILELKNGVIEKYHVTYTRDDDSSDTDSITTQETKMKLDGLKSGKIYKFEVFAVNHFGRGPPGETTLKIPVDANDVTVYIAVIAVVTTLLVVVLVVLIVCVYRNQKQNRRRQGKNNLPQPRDQMERGIGINIALVERSTPPGVQNNALYSDVEEVDSFELRRDKIEFQKLLGKGSFGEVSKAVIRNRIVAVKSLKENALSKDKQDLQTELNVMKRLDPHPHVVQLIGCCSCNGPLLIVLEYLPYGDLLGYLRKSRGHKDNYNTGEKAPKSKLTPTDLLSFAWMIADGMSYLAKMKVVHRDLAARNVLVGENKVCKISDFGLARGVDNDIYVRRTQARLPVKWMPPESLFHGLSSTMSDVWSYGILLWEVFTIGDSPYPGIKANRVASLLESGYRMPRPLHISEELFAIMSECWSQKPEDRPTFNWISTAIKRLQKDKKTYINLDLYEDKDYVNFDMFHGQQ